MQLEHTLNFLVPNPLSRLFAVPFGSDWKQADHIQNKFGEFVYFSLRKGRGNFAPTAICQRINTQKSPLASVYF